MRYIEDIKPTLLIDEADSFVSASEELRGILNSGHTKVAANVIRNVETNGEHRPKRFSVWAPKAIATIRDLADTLEDRSIVIQLQRKPKTAKVARLILCAQAFDVFSAIATSHGLASRKHAGSAHTCGIL